MTCFVEKHWSLGTRWLPWTDWAVILISEHLCERRSYFAGTSGGDSQKTTSMRGLTHWQRKKLFSEVRVDRTCRPVSTFQKRMFSCEEEYGYFLSLALFCVSHSFSEWSHSRKGKKRGLTGCFPEVFATKKHTPISCLSCCVCESKFNDIPILSASFCCVSILRWHGVFLSSLVHNFHSCHQMQHWSNSATEWFHFFLSQFHDRC